jgi:hypothetical protein
MRCFVPRDNVSLVQDEKQLGDAFLDVSQKLGLNLGDWRVYRKDYDSSIR